MPPDSTIEHDASREGDARVLRALSELVEPLAAALGSGTEVALHDLSRVPNSIIAISNPITGRSVGSPMTNFLLRRVRQGRTDHAFRYHTVSGDGRNIRSSTVFVTNGDGEAIGCLCLNTDVTPWLAAQALVDSVVDGVTMHEEEGTEVSASGAVSEEFSSTVEDLTVALIAEVIAAVGVPVHLMRKPHKLEVVRQLEEAGVFLIRDAVDYVAAELDVSRYSIYNYLNELNDNDQGSRPRRRARFNSVAGAEDAESATPPVSRRGRKARSSGKASAGAGESKSERSRSQGSKRKAGAG